MITGEDLGHWRRSFPALAKLEPDVFEKLASASRLLEVGKNQVVFNQGGPVEHFFFLLGGSVRVSLTSEEGTEIMLYRLSSGDTCILTTVCLLSGDAYCARAMTESQVQAVAAPAGLIQDLFEQSRGFRRLLFSSLISRILDLVQLVQSVSFTPISLRLACNLCERAGSCDDLKVTHQELADDLGTAREVISRNLKRFEDMGMIALHRGRIQILARESLGCPTTGASLWKS